MAHGRYFATPAEGVIGEFSLDESKLLSGFHSVSSQGQKGAKAGS